VPDVLARTRTAVARAGLTDVFGDRVSGAYLLRFAWTPITRHPLIKGWASPDDPAMIDYWAPERQDRRQDH
jgi:hypothetical protein